ncbi:efflux RND transporter permease subunit [Acuticoccus mangrovi]|uniref:Efflux RND transporter permease subunit n=1 Tax=Acuticoccus mangrovi TaxID=2796142 RepID=A0A934IIS2_9HYPH|nr:efflux RND transporter permease subunit [Acuticoccus mangrovi]MBJ3777454.1 efflux RND transporter permease subunit [Acuticoccus mangrovi]
MNGLLEGLLSRPRSLITLLLFLVTAGAVVYTTIPKEANPDIDVPVFYVSITQQGISPEDAQRLLVKPMEKELRGLDGLKEIRAVASESHAGIILEFEADFDKDEALADVRDKVDQAKADLPEDAEEPTITETNFSLVPTIVVALSGDVPERTLYQRAKELQDQIEAIPTVLSADLSGARDEQLEVLVDRTLMESYGLNPVELLQSLQRNNALVPAGFIDTGEGRFSVKVPGLVETPQDVYSLVIKQQAEGVVTVGDVATVRRTFEDPTTFTRVNGRPAITIEVVKRLGENIIENNQAVRDAVEETTADWPDSIKVDYLLDQSNFIYEVLGSLEASISTAIVLVMIVVVAALGFRSALLVGIAIPTSILLGFLVLSGLGMTVNMMVMFGLVLTVGLLVDGAIVVVEYADRRIAEGASRADAFQEAAKLMVWPLISSTATTLIAFLPMLLWPGVAGEFMSYLPIMVVIVLTVALVTAMVFLPVVGALLSNAIIAGLFAGMVVAAGAVMLLAPFGAMAYVAAVAGFLGAAILTTSLANRWAARRPKTPPIPHETLFNPSAVRGVTGLYVRVLRLLAGNVAGVVLTGVAVVGIAVWVMMLFSANNKGVEFFVNEEPDVAVVMVSGRGNMSAREALNLVKDVEREVLAVDGVEDVVTKAFPSGASSGSGGGIGDVNDKPADLIGQLQVELVNYCCRRPALDIFEDIRARTAFPGIKTEVRKVEGGPPTGKDIQLQVSSNNYDTLLAVTKRVHDHVATVEGLRDVEDDRPLPGIEWQLDVDREEAGRFGADVQTVGQIIQLVTNGVLLSRYQPDDSDDQIDIRIRFPEQDRTLRQFADLRLPSSSGLVPIINFIDITPQQRVSAITRIDGQFAMTVKADVLDQQGYDLNAKIAELDAWVKSQTWPDGVTFMFRGANEDQAEAMGFLMKAMIASLVMMFLVLVTQFNSFYQTALTLLTIILSVFGVLLGMVITGQKFSVIMTGTGVIALAGIVVNNAIVLIDTFNRERTLQPDMLTAVLSTAAQRVRPILLTTITTIAGLIPMATEVNLDFFSRTIAVGGITAVWWVQLSTAIISGLAFSTILTLVVVPVMLAMPETVSRRFGRRGSAAAAPSAPLAPAAPPAAPAPVAATPALPMVASAEVAPAPTVEETAETYAQTAAPHPPVAAPGHAAATRAEAPPLDVYAPVVAPQRRPGDERRPHVKQAAE